MINNLIQDICQAFVFGIIAFVYAVILTDAGHIFAGLYKLLERALPEWLFFPIIGCEKCVSGQLALWVLVSRLVKNWFHLHRASGFPFTFYGSYHLLDQIDFIRGAFIICTSILFTAVFKKFYSWLKN